MDITYKQARTFLIHYKDSDLIAIQKMIAQVSVANIELYTFLESCLKMNKLISFMEEERIEWNSEIFEMYHNMIDYLYNQCIKSRNIHEQSILRSIIDCNMRYFFEYDFEKLAHKEKLYIWKTFKAKCITTCKEQMPDLEESFIILEINKKSNQWLEFVNKYIKGE